MYVNDSILVRVFSQKFLLKIFRLKVRDTIIVTMRKKGLEDNFDIIFLKLHTVNEYPIVKWFKILKNCCWQKWDFAIKNNILF